VAERTREPRLPGSRGADQEDDLVLADPAATRRLFENVPRPDQYPVWQRLLVDSEGWIWAERFRTSDENPALWTLFNPAGLAAGSVELPPDLDVHQIGDDFVLGVWHDEDGVEYVRRYRLDR
jgi:hypothetical protein